MTGVWGVHRLSPELMSNMFFCINDYISQTRYCKLSEFHLSVTKFLGGQDEAGATSTYGDFQKHATPTSISNAAIYDRCLSYNTTIPSRWLRPNRAATLHLRKPWLCQKSSSAAASARRPSLRFTRHRRATRDFTVVQATTTASLRDYGLQSARTSYAASICQEEVGRCVA